MFRGKHFKTLLMAGAAVAVASFGGAAFAQTREFDVPAGDAAQAIQSFNQQAGVQVNARPGDLAGLQTGAVSGSMDVRAALEALIAGTELSIVSSNNSVYTIARNAASEVESVVVTAGSSIKGVKPAGAEVITIDRSDFLAAGSISAAEVLNNQPQFQNNLGSGVSETRSGISRTGGQNGDTNKGNGSGVDLRGLGQGSTLVLIDGRRVAPAGVNSYSEANQVPLAALERIEIVADSASAIYGSDAVAGVVNYVIRKNYNGAEATVRNTNQLGANTYALSLVGGKAWEAFGGGNFLASFEYEDRQNTPSTASPYTRQDLRGLGGNNVITNNNATPLSKTPYISVKACPNGEIYNSTPPFIEFCSGGSAVTTANLAVPAGNTGIPTIGQIQATGAPTYFDNADYTDFLPRRIRRSGTVYLNQRLTDWLTMSYQAVVNRYEDRERFGFRSTTQAVRSTSPFFIPGVPGGSSSYNVTFPVGESIVRTKQTLTSNTLAFAADIFGDWTADFAGTISSVRDNGQLVKGFESKFVNNDALQLQINSATASINPYDTALPTEAELAKYVGDERQATTRIVRQATAKIQGTVIALPGGPIKAALGVDHLRETNDHVQYFSTLGTPILTYHEENGGSDARTINAAFAELSVPLVGSENALPLVRSLNFSVAGRYEEFSDAGITKNPKLGLSWKPSDSLTIRATYGTAFRAPPLTERSTGVKDTFFHTGIPVTNLTAKYASLGRNPTGIYILGKANSQLKPETATNFSFGIDWQPEFINGLRLSTTYYNIDYKDKIDTPNAFNWLNNESTAVAYSTFIVPITPPANCNPLDATTYPKELLDRLPPGVAAYMSTQPFNRSQVCRATVLLDGRSQNTGRQQQSGVDLSGSYRLTTELGNFNFSGNYTRVLQLDVLPVLGLPKVANTLGYLGGQVKNRARLQGGWNSGPYSVNVSVNYTGKYLDDQRPIIEGKTLDVIKVPAWTTVGLGFAYTAQDDAPTWAHGIRAALNFQNIFEKKPPYAPTTSSVYDASNANIFGRVTTFQLTKAF